MSFPLYKPNSKNSGNAFTFSQGVNRKNGEPSFFISAIAQHSWNDEKRIGTFAGNSGDSDKKVNVKISEFECGEFISAFENRYDYSTFHSFEGNNTTIKLSPWDKPTKISKYDSESKGFKDEQVTRPAFGISITKGKGNTFKVALEPGEVIYLKKVIGVFLEELVRFRIAKQKEDFKNRQNESDSTTRSPFKKETVATASGVQEDAGDSEDEPPF